MMGIVVPETCWAYKKYNKVLSGIYSRELLTMGIAVSETCWASKKYNKIISGN